MPEKLVVIGNGMAGMRTVEELLKLDTERYEITVFGAEPYGNYNRILLSPVLAGETAFSDTMLNDEDWYEEKAITFYKERAVVEIDRSSRCVTAEDGTQVPYDRLLIATGSQPVTLPVPGHELDGVVAFRNIGDVESMLNVSEVGRRAVVIGGGLLGLEAAHGLSQRGMTVTVVHLVDTLMERQLDPTAGQLLKDSLEERGVQFLMSYETQAILGDRHVEAVRFTDGTQVDADLVVMAAGIRPEIELARSAGLHCHRGIVVSDTLQTYDPRIYAVGECVEHRGKTYGLVAPLFEQARVCANHLAEAGTSQYEGSMTSTQLKVTGIDMFSAGELIGAADTDEMIFCDKSRGVYKKLVLHDNRIAGVVLFGDTMDGSWYFQLMREGVDVSDMRERLLFGQAHMGNTGHGEGRVAALPDEAEICGCNGVGKGTIIHAIRDKKCFTLDEVRAHTKASSSCGSCTGLVEQLLAVTLGGDYSQPPTKKPLCGCTEFAHDEVRTAIYDHELKSIPAVMHFLEWGTPDGCSKCRPALNYYLLCAWPGEYVDDNQARFVNERAHANIQKDGTFSVVPRIWGGETSPTQLKSIAEIAERHRVPTVKVTGGQRIDLLGVQKHQLPAMWRDLSEAGFVSGHAYGKAVRTVKTCVGSEWCRFGTQDSTTMGIEMEKMTWGAWTPHKFKMGVSGCPRNCAEATIKDLGVVAVDSGWELHVGGNGGVKVRATDLLGKVDTMEEVLEYTAAFLQLYREEAHYLERTAPWIERVGLSHIKDRVVDDGPGRRALAERFRHAQEAGAQLDPWQSRAQGNDTGEYMPLRRVG